MAPSEPIQPGFGPWPTEVSAKRPPVRVTVKPRAPYHRTKVEKMAYRAGFRAGYAGTVNQLHLRQNEAINAYSAGYKHGQQVQARKEAA